MNYFKEYILNPVKHGLEHGDDGIPLPESLSNLSNYTNYTKKGQTICISGLPNSGKTSFMDYVYLLNTYIWWKKLDENSRPPLKFIYFNMKHSLKDKLQKWLCLYMKMQYDQIIDIPTLNSGVGKMFELDQTILERINTGQELFNDLFNEDILTIINGPQTPSSIFNKVNNVMKSAGDFEEENGRKKFKYGRGKGKQITIVFIDTVDNLLNESDSQNQMDSVALKKKMSDYISELESTYNLITVLVAPTKPSIARSVKETEPNYKNLGVFSTSADLGLVLYNPYDENNNDYLNYPIKDFVIRGKNRFRTVTIVRNVNGLSNIGKAMVFIGECGYFREAPRPDQEADLRQLLTILNEFG